MVIPTHRWVSQTIQPSQHTIGFHKLLGNKPKTSQDMTNPTNSWAYQDVKAMGKIELLS